MKKRTKEAGKKENKNASNKEKKKKALSSEKANRRAFVPGAIGLTIDRAINRAINFIQKEQRTDGAFWCLVSTKQDDYSAEHTNRVPAIVPTNIVLSSLNKLDSAIFPKIDLIKKRAADFLIGERGEYWSYNYWFRISDWFKKEPYPDDTDDTFCALAALREYDPSLFDGTAMALIITMLTSSEKAEGGPYDMWLVPPDGRDAWSDLDLVCNSNIAFFLSLEGISLPKVDAFIEASIEAQSYEFPYNTIYPGIYFVSRYYKGEKCQKIIDLLISRQEKDGRWQNPLRTALAVSSLINLSGIAGIVDSARPPYFAKILSHVRKGAEYLIRTQEADGSWPVNSFYYQMKTPKKTLFAGSAAMTTALCIEALNKFSKVVKLAEFVELAEIESSLHQSSIRSLRAPSSRPELEVTNIAPGKSEEYKKIYSEVVKLVKRRFAGYASLRQEAHNAIDTMLKIDKGDKGPDGIICDEIVLLPYIFRNSLGVSGLHREAKEESRISEELLIQLGAANLYGWIAYTIYDDFLDEEGDSRVLPVANVCHREAVLIFNSVGHVDASYNFARFARKTMDIIDDANAWETMNCRLDARNANTKAAKSAGKNIISIPDFADYAQLANRSLGHTLGPAAILFNLSYAENSRQFSEVMNFFKHYIIARQLNDDAHDWEDDLRRGQINSVSALILSDSALRGAGTDTKGASLEADADMVFDMEKLRHIFWNKTIVEVCRKTIRQVNLSRKSLKKAGIIKDTKIFDKMLSQIEKLVEKTLEERKQTLSFLRAYSTYRK